MLKCFAYMYCKTATLFPPNKKKRKEKKRNETNIKKPTQKQQQCSRYAIFNQCNKYLATGN